MEIIKHSFAQGEVPSFALQLGKVIDIAKEYNDSYGGLTTRSLCDQARNIIGKGQVKVRTTALNLVQFSEIFLTKTSL